MFLALVTAAKGGTATVPTSGCVGEQIAVMGVLVSHKKGCGTDTHHSTDGNHGAGEKSGTMATWCVVPFTGHPQSCDPQTEDRAALSRQFSRGDGMC